MWLWFHKLSSPPYAYRMVDRYGDYVLYKPPLVARTLVLWGAPILLLLGGGAIAAFVIARKSHLPDTDPADPGLGAS